MSGGGEWGSGEVICCGRSRFVTRAGRRMKTIRMRYLNVRICTHELIRAKYRHARTYIHKRTRP